MNSPIVSHEHLSILGKPALPQMHLRHQVRFPNCLTESAFSPHFPSCEDIKTTLPFQPTEEAGPIPSSFTNFRQIFGIVFLKLIRKKKKNIDKKTVDIYRLLFLILGMSPRQGAASLQSTQLLSVGGIWEPFSCSVSTGNICSEIKKESIKAMEVLLNLAGRGPSGLALIFVTYLMALQRDILLLEIVERLLQRKDGRNTKEFPSADRKECCSCKIPH